MPVVLVLRGTVGSGTRRPLGPYVLDTRRHVYLSGAKVEGGTGVNDTHVPSAMAAGSANEQELAL